MESCLISFVPFVMLGNTSESGLLPIGLHMQRMWPRVGVHRQKIMCIKEEDQHGKGRRKILKVSVVEQQQQQQLY